MMNKNNKALNNNEYLKRQQITAETSSDLQLIQTIKQGKKEIANKEVVSWKNLKQELGV